MNMLAIYFSNYNLTLPKNDYNSILHFDGDF